MTRCEDAQEALVLALSGEPEKGLSVELEAHLRGCASCAGEAEQLGEAIDALRRDEPPDPGMAYWAAFGGRLRARIAGARRRSRARTLLAAAAAAVVVAMAGLAGYRLLALRRPPSPSVGAEQSAADLGEDRRLEALLQRAAADAQGQRNVETILDEMAPGSPLELEEAIAPPSAPESDGAAEEYPGT